MFPVVVAGRECRAGRNTAKAMEGVEDLDVQAPKSSPAYGVWNVQKVTAGTGEALPGPMTCGIVIGELRSITGDAPGSEWQAGRASEAVVVLIEPGGQHNPR